MINLTLKDLYFGDIDGTDEAKNKNLFETFYNLEDDYVENITKNKYFLISGKKGTGKTLLAHYIKNCLEMNKSSICTIKNLEGFKIQKSLLIKENDFENGEEILFWKWVILLEFAKVIIDNSNLYDKYVFGSRKKLFKYYNDLISNKAFAKQEMTHEQLESNSLSIKKIIGAEWTNVDKVISKFRKSEYKEMLLKLEKLVRLSINELSIYLIIDDVDELKINLSKSTEYQEIINGLIQAMSQINNSFDNMNKNGAIHSILVIRDDIIDQIHPHSSNSNKKIAEKTILLDWRGNKDEVKSSPIIKMIIQKIRLADKKLNDLNDDEIYSLFFQDDSIQYIFDRGFFRPRDFIKYLNIIRKEYPSNSKITTKMLKNCLTKYSEYFYHEILNEMAIHREPEYNLQCLKLIEDFNFSIFSVRDIKDFYNKNKNNYPMIKNVEDTLKYLYSFGVVGNVINKDKQNWYCFYYRSDGRKDITPGINIVVHRGLWKKFNMKGNSDKNKFRDVKKSNSYHNKTKTEAV